MSNLIGYCCTLPEGLLYDAERNLLAIAKFFLSKYRVQKFSKRRTNEQTDGRGRTRTDGRKNWQYTKIPRLYAVWSGDRVIKIIYLLIKLCQMEMFFLWTHLSLGIYKTLVNWDACQWQRKKMPTNEWQCMIMPKEHHIDDPHHTLSTSNSFSIINCHKQQLNLCVVLTVNVKIHQNTFSVTHEKEAKNVDAEKSGHKEIVRKAILPLGIRHCMHVCTAVIDLSKHTTS